MVTNLILLAIAAAIFYGYTYGYVYNTVGILKSISDSVYHVKNKYLFQFTMMGFPIFFIIPAENVAINWLGEFTAFFGGAGIILVGVAAVFDKTDIFEMKIHTIGATGGILLGTLFTASFGGWFIPIAILFTLFVLYCHFLPKIKIKLSNKEIKIPFYYKLPIVHNHTWVIEVVAVNMILGTVLIQSLKL